jgi:hypothetical protein
VTLDEPAQPALGSPDRREERMRYTVARFVLGVFLSVGLSPFASAQDELFKIGPIAGMEEKYPALREVLRLPTTINVGVGTLGVELAKAADVVTFKVGTRSTRLKTKSWRQVGNEFSWSAVGVDSPWETGCLLVAGATTRGAIYTKDGVFSIDPIGENMHAVVRFDPRKLPGDRSPSHRGTTTSEISPVPARRAAPVSINVLVAFAKSAAQTHLTPAARQAWVDDVINITNCSYVNSDIDIELVRSASSPYLVDYQESGFTTDLNLLMGKNDGIMEDIHSVRLADKADLVVLIIGRGSAFCGRAATTLATREQAFAIVRLDCAKGKLSFAHEIGHLQGASHQNEPGKYPFGHGFCQGGRGTVMSAGCGLRYPIWSHPPDLGSTNHANNVRVLNTTADMMGSLIP